MSFTNDFSQLVITAAVVAAFWRHVGVGRASICKQWRPDADETITHAKAQLYKHYAVSDAFVTLQRPAAWQRGA